jgi:hypothetical protein
MYSNQSHMWILFSGALYMFFSIQNDYIVCSAVSTSVSQSLLLNLWGRQSVSFTKCVYGLKRLHEEKYCQRPAHRHANLLTDALCGRSSMVGWRSSEYVYVA